jgi:hypothetical protein
MKFQWWKMRIFNRVETLLLCILAAIAKAVP